MIFEPEWRAHVAPYAALGERADLADLADLAAQIERLQQKLAVKVQLARQAGVSWSVIGREVGYSRQGAQQRWDHSIES